MYVRVSDASRTLEVGFEESYDYSSRLRAGSAGVRAACDGGAAVEFPDVVESIAGRVVGLFESRLAGVYDSRSLGGFVDGADFGAVGGECGVPKVRGEVVISDITKPRVEISATSLGTPCGGSKVGHDSTSVDSKHHVVSGAGDTSDSNGRVVLNKTLANRQKRAKHKARKLRKQQALSDAGVPEWRRKHHVDLSSGENRDVELGRNGKPVKESVGFWRSCSDDVRQKLIDSKAEMHIAENKRKTREAMNRVDYLDSAQACVDKVVCLVERANQIAAKEGNDKILGWAKTVTSTSVESLARSAPSTVPSFESVSSAIDEAARLEAARAAEKEKKEVELQKKELEERMSTIVKLTREVDEHVAEKERLRKQLASVVKPSSRATDNLKAVVVKQQERQLSIEEKKRAEAIANRKPGRVYDRLDALCGRDKGRPLTTAEYLAVSRYGPD